MADAELFPQTSRARALGCADVCGFGTTPTDLVRRAGIHAGMPAVPETAVRSPVPMADARPFPHTSARALGCADVCGACQGVSRGRSASQGRG